MKKDKSTIQKLKAIEAVDPTCGVHVSGVNEIELKKVYMPRATYANLVMRAQEKKLSISRIIALAIEKLLLEETKKTVR